MSMSPEAQMPMEDSVDNNDAVSKRVQHRGLSTEVNPGLPNSFESFRERYGQAIELDVFLLRDGNIVVLHNKDLGLTQEQVEAMSLEDAEKISIPNRAGGESGPIPLFDEFTFNCLDRGNGLVIEIKASSPEVAQTLARKLIERISSLSQEDKTFIQHPEYINQLGLHSFSIEALEEARKAKEEYDISSPLGLFWSSTPKNAEDMKISATALERSGYQTGDDWIQKGIDMAHELGVQSINLHWSVIDQDVVRKVHEKNLRIIAWVVSTEEKARELEQMGVDTIIIED